MNKLLSYAFMASLSFSACSQTPIEINSTKVDAASKSQKAPFSQLKELTIDSYFSNPIGLDALVNIEFNKLTSHQRVAQLIMPAMGRLGLTEEAIYKLVKEEKIGGVLMLNGTKEQFTTWIKTINEKNNSMGAVPFFFSADAEPSLVNRKITGSTPVKKANEIETLDDVKAVAQTISNDLKSIGINYNFAPVADMSANGTVGYRGFGKKAENIVPFCEAFVNISKDNNIITSIKHFPGHGLVSGDTHKSLQAIDGELKELENFKNLIAMNVPSVMIGHLAVVNNTKYNTNGLPATASPVIIRDLLRKELGYNGIVITDAMNMGGVLQVPNANCAVIEAGCDIILMPLDANKAHSELLKRYNSDEEFSKIVDEAVRRILRMKICMGLIKI